ncbi:MAG: hypothetical protein IAE79_05810 [Anaerolinea sp.]|nr:hypothetical protein [Anaerolinea sp.]
MNAEQLEDLHKLVWRFRQLAQPDYPTPNPVDSLYYAFTEAGEAIDAMLRKKRPNDKRNNRRNLDPLDEWADCAFMVLTALSWYRGSECRGIYEPVTFPVTVEFLCTRLAGHLYPDPQYALDNDPEDALDNHDLALTVALIARLPGIDLTERVRGRLTRIVYRHIPAWRWEKFADILPGIRPFCVELGDEDENGF